MAREYPDAGGAATFVKLSFSHHLGNVVGWFYFATAAIGQTIVSLTGAFYVGQAFSFTVLGEPCIALIILMIAGTTNYFGLKVSGKVALVISTCLLLLLLSAVLVAIPYIEWRRFTPFVSKGWYSVGIAVTIIFWAFFGWEAICNLACHLKNPKIIIVKSTLISAVVISILFMALSVVTIGTATYGNVESNLSPISVIMGKFIGIEAQVVTALLALMICVGTSNALVASLTQLGYSLSIEGAFPKKLSVLHSTKQIPRRVVIFVIGFAVVGVIFSVYFSWTFNDLLFIPTSLGIFVYIFSMAAGVKLFAKKTWPWYSSLISFILCILVLPFLKLYSMVPFILMILYFVYMIIDCKISKGDVHRDFAK